MENIEIISEDLKKGLILLKSILRKSTGGMINFKEVTTTLVIIDKLLMRLENLKEAEEDDYSIDIVLDE